MEDGNIIIDEDDALDYILYKDLKDKGNISQRKNGGCFSIIGLFILLPVAAYSKCQMVKWGRTESAD